MKNFSDALAAFDDLTTVEGVLIIDSDALTLGSSFSGEFYLPASAAMHALLNDVFRHLFMLNESANQIILVQEKRIILAQPIYDIALIVYSQKTALERLQSRFTAAVKILEKIATPDFSNT
jgi:predicted regulator of Ras-like GTPase activity (Roadblock/LC7/MglB family)